MEVMPYAPAGIVSAGLNRREYKSQVLFCGIQSVYKKAFGIGKTDLLIVDEAHMLSLKSNSMWQTFITDLRAMNPNMLICGYTATPYRQDSGLLHTGDNAMFDELVYEYNIKEGIEDGFLSTIIPKSMDTNFDLSGVAKNAGDFVESQLQKAVNKEEITLVALDEIEEYGKERKGWLIFSSGVKHAHAIDQALSERGYKGGVIDGKTPNDERDELIRAFKAQELRYLVNNAVLTKGFDAPHIDLLAMLRPTISPVLWTQMVGRGLRLNSGKENCLLLDFAENIQRFGFIDEISFKDKGEKKAGVPPMKECPECDTINYASAKHCMECGYEFPVVEEVKIQAKAYDGAVLSTQNPPKTYDVKQVYYDVQVSKKGIPMLVVTYTSGFMSMHTFKEYVLVEHEGYAKQKAISWWRKRTNEPMPNTAEDALNVKLLEPSQITIVKDGKYDRVQSHVLPELLTPEQSRLQQLETSQYICDEIPF